MKVKFAEICGPTLDQRWSTALDGKARVVASLLMENRRRGALLLVTLITVIVPVASGDSEGAHGTSARCASSLRTCEFDASAAAGEARSLTREHHALAGHLGANMSERKHGGFVSGRAPNGSVSRGGKPEPKPLLTAMAHALLYFEVLLVVLALSLGFAKGELDGLARDMTILSQKMLAH